MSDEQDRTIARALRHVLAPNASSLPTANDVTAGRSECACTAAAVLQRAAEFFEVPLDAHGFYSSAAGLLEVARFERAAKALLHGVDGGSTDDERAQLEAAVDAALSVGAWRDQRRRDEIVFSVDVLLSSIAILASSSGDDPEDDELGRAIVRAAAEVVERTRTSRVRRSTVLRHVQKAIDNLRSGEEEEDRRHKVAANERRSHVPTPSEWASENLIAALEEMSPAYASLQVGVVAELLERAACPERDERAIGAPYVAAALSIQAQGFVESRVRQGETENMARERVAKAFHSDLQRDQASTVVAAASVIESVRADRRATAAMSVTPPTVSPAVSTSPPAVDAGSTSSPPAGGVVTRRVASGRASARSASSRTAGRPGKASRAR